MSKSKSTTPADPDFPKSMERAALDPRVDISRRQLQSWIHEGCPGRREDGTYSVPEIAEWKKKNRPGPQYCAPDGNTNTLTAAKLRKEIAAAEMIELKLARARGELVPVDVVQAEISEQITIAGTFLRDIGYKVAGALGLEGPEKHRVVGVVEQTIALVFEAMVRARDKVEEVAQNEIKHAAGKDAAKEKKSSRKSATKAKQPSRRAKQFSSLTTRISPPSGFAARAAIRGNNYAVARAVADHRRDQAG